MQPSSPGKELMENKAVLVSLQHMVYNMYIQHLRLTTQILAILINKKRF